MLIIFWLPSLLDLTLELFNARSRRCFRIGLAHSIKGNIASSFGSNACQTAAESHLDTRSHLKTTIQSSIYENTICWISGGNSSRGNTKDSYLSLLELGKFLSRGELLDFVNEDGSPNNKNELIEKKKLIEFCTW